MDNWLVDTIKPQRTLSTYLVLWTHSSSESSHSSHIRSSISFWLNVNAPLISLSSPSFKASSLTSSSSSTCSSPSLVGGGLGVQSSVRRPTTSLPLVHALGAFKSVLKIIWHLGLSCKTKLLLGLSLSFARKTCSTSFGNMKGWSLMWPSPKNLEVLIEQNKQSSNRVVL